MSPSEILLSIKSIWLKSVVLNLARGSLLKEDLTEQFIQFFNQLQLSIETGDPAWFDPLLEKWSSSSTQSDLEDNQNTLIVFVKELILLTHNICLEYLPQDQALIIFNSMLPIFVYIFEKTTFYETKAKVNYYKKELERTQTTLNMLDRTKSSFIAVAAHELKTPLTLVEGYTAMLRDIAKSNVPEKDFDIYIEGILIGTKRLQAIVNDMIDVTLIESNLLKLNLQPMWINRLFDSLLLELRTILIERNITIKLNDYDGYKIMNYGDQEKILQVFRNILLNAIKFTPDGGTIEINGRKLPGFIETTIADSGIGIKLEDQTLIFEKFSKVGDVTLHSSGKSKYKGGGPGLGLHIAKGIIESHGGSIWVESPGYDETNYPGSTFHILLPLRNNPPENINNDLMKKIEIQTNE